MALLEVQVKEEQRARLEAEAESHALKAAHIDELRTAAGLGGAARVPVGLPGTAAVPPP